MLRAQPVPPASAPTWPPSIVADVHDLVPEACLTPRRQSPPRASDRARASPVQSAVPSPTSSPRDDNEPKDEVETMADGALRKSQQLLKQLSALGLWEEDARVAIKSPREDGESTRGDLGVSSSGFATPPCQLDIPPSLVEALAPKSGLDTVEVPADLIQQLAGLWDRFQDIQGRSEFTCRASKRESLREAFCSTRPPSSPGLSQGGSSSVSWSGAASSTPVLSACPSSAGLLETAQIMHELRRVLSPKPSREPSLSARTRPLSARSRPMTRGEPCALSRDPSLRRIAPAHPVQQVLPLPSPRGGPAFTPCPVVPLIAVQPHVHCAPPSHVWQTVVEYKLASVRSVLRPAPRSAR